MTEYDDKGVPVVNAESVPLLFDPYEQYGCMLRVCTDLGWKYCCKTATHKLAQFINKNWMKHLQVIFAKEQEKVSYKVDFHWLIFV
jgi:hypothetical protein